MPHHDMLRNRAKKRREKFIKKLNMGMFEGKREENIEEALKSSSFERRRSFTVIE